MDDPLPPLDRAALIEALAASCVRAGAAILDVYAQDFAVTTKADASPVTAADEAAEAILLADLATAAPGVPVVAEERASAGDVPECGRRFFLVDPLDGTREFVSRNGDFTVNVALVEDGAAVVGLVLAPARGELFVGDVGAGAWRADVADGTIGARRPIAVRVRAPGGAVAVASRSHRTPETDAWLAANGITKTIAVGSSLKLCLVACGEADVYPRFGPTMEWDIAAGHAVLSAAGGSVRTPDDATFGYGKPGFRNADFVAWGAG